MANTGKAQRFDPYRNFKFKVKINNEIVAGLSKMSALKKSTEGIDWFEAGDNFNPRRLPGKTKYEPITLEKGMTEDKVFEDWANLVNKFQGNIIAPDNFRKDIQILVCNMNGEPKITFNVFNCWVSEFQAVPDMDVTQNGVAIQTIKLENEGFDRG
jgi:phage tail-like protein